jgi:nucleoside-diphosphate-sugar epimerase
MRIAITGATGFLGRYLVRRLEAAGHQLRCLCRPSSDRAGFEKQADALEWLPGTLGDPAAIAKLVQGVDAVVHAAVEWEGTRVAGRGTPSGAGVYLGTNLSGSLELFETAFNAGIPRFIFVSSCSVHDVILDNRQLDETHPLWPRSHYGAHKAALEAFVHSFGLGQGWPICALRPTGIYGLARPAQASKWYDLVGQVLRGENVESARGGKEVHAADVARAAALLLEAPSERITGESFNCYDLYVAEEHVARIAKEFTGSASSISNLNRGPKHQIDTQKIRALGMTFGGEKLLRQTVQELVEAQK